MKNLTENEILFMNREELAEFLDSNGFWVFDDMDFDYLQAEALKMATEVA